MATEVGLHVAAGRAAMDRGAWDEAADAFGRALAVENDPVVQEELAWASWWLGDEARLFAARALAHRGFAAAGAPADAARVAAWIASDHLDFRGEDAIAGAWLARARRLLDGEADGATAGWILVIEADLATARGELEGARRAADRAVEVGRRHGVPDLEAIGAAQVGAALVRIGRTDEGLRRFDEAAAVLAGGGFRLRLSPGWALCSIVSACESAGDFPRAAQWCTYMRTVAEQLGGRLFVGVCRASLGTVLATSGDWPAGEAELAAAVDDLGATRPLSAPRALVRLGELRVRQGRDPEARELFERALPYGPAVLGLGALALDAGDARSAADAAERVLRAVGADDVLGRAAPLELLVRARAALADHDEGLAALERLEAVVAAAGTAYAHARARRAAGELHAARGTLDAARRAFEDATDRFAASDAPYDAALAREGLAAVLARLGRDDAAAAEAASAERELRRLGAERDAERVRRAAAGRSAGELTAREREVLVLVAEGLSDAQIAERLVVSPHTVHRHVANVRAKLRLPSRAAAVGYAARHDLL